MACLWQTGASTGVGPADENHCHQMGKAGILYARPDKCAPNPYFGRPNGKHG
jgi:hypothetical protein